MYKLKIRIIRKFVFISIIISWYKVNILFRGRNLTYLHFSHIDVYIIYNQYIHYIYIYIYIFICINITKLDQKKIYIYIYKNVSFIILICINNIKT